MYVRLGVVIALFNVQLAWVLAPALGALFVLGAGLAAYEWRSTAEQQHSTNLSLPTANPLQIPTAFIFAAIFVVISVATFWIARHLAKLVCWSWQLPWEQPISIHL